LYGTDGPQEARAALDYVAELAAETRAAVACVSVHPVVAPLRAVRGGGIHLTEVEEPEGPQHIAEAARRSCVPAASR
jgi:hypothetical protein